MSKRYAVTIDGPDYHKPKHETWEEANKERMEYADRTILIAYGDVPWRIWDYSHTTPADVTDMNPESPVRTDYSREELVDICERAVVPESKWHDRDSQSAQAKLGTAWSLLRAGCDFTVLTHEGDGWGLNTDAKTIWVEIRSRGFNYFEHGGDNWEVESYYLPTPERLDQQKGEDWY